MHSDLPELVECRYESRRGVDAGEWFTNRLIINATTIDQILQYTNYEIKANTGKKLKHIIADKFDSCKKPFTGKNFKTADHEHLTGAYRNAACVDCSLKARKDFYELHLLIRNLAKQIPKMRVIVSGSISSCSELLDSSDCLNSRFSLSSPSSRLISRPAK